MAAYDIASIGSVNTLISTHNTDTSSHPDIRTAAQVQAQQDTARMDAIQAQVQALANLGHFLFSVSAYTDIPTTYTGTVALLPGGTGTPTINDWITVSVDATHGNDTTVYRINALDSSANTVSFVYDHSITVDMSGKVDIEATYSSGNLGGTVRNDSVATGLIRYIDQATSPGSGQVLVAGTQVRMAVLDSNGPNILTLTGTDANLSFSGSRATLTNNSLIRKSELDSSLTGFVPKQVVDASNGTTKIQHDGSSIDITYQDPGNVGATGLQLSSIGAGMSATDGTNGGVLTLNPDDAILHFPIGSRQSLAGSSIVTKGDLASDSVLPLKTINGNSIRGSGNIALSTLSSLGGSPNNAEVWVKIGQMTSNTAAEHCEFWGSCYRARYWVIHGIVRRKYNAGDNQIIKFETMGFPPSTRPPKLYCCTDGSIWMDIMRGYAETRPIWQLVGTMNGVDLPFSEMFTSGTAGDTPITQYGLTVASEQEPTWMPNIPVPPDTTNNYALQCNAGSPVWAAPEPPATSEYLTFTKPSGVSSITANIQRKGKMRILTVNFDVPASTAVSSDTVYTFAQSDWPIEVTGTGLAAGNAAAQGRLTLDPNNGILQFRGYNDNATSTAAIQGQLVWFVA